MKNRDAGAIFTALLFLVLLGIGFCGLMFFASLWTKHQDDHSPEPCEGKTCTCAGTRHKNDTLYKYACECCPASGCKPDSSLDLTPKKKAKVKA